MDAEMTDVKDTTTHHHAAHEVEEHHNKQHQDDQDMADDEEAVAPATSAAEHDAAAEATSGAQDPQQYDQQYDESYDQQYEAGEEGVEGDVGIYEEQAAGEGEYEQDPNGVAYENDEAVDAAAAVASAVAAAAVAPGDQEYSEQQQGEAGDEYAEQQHEGEYVDDPNAQQYAEHEGIDEQHEEMDNQQGDMVDDQTLASHPATSREMEVAESMVVDSEHNPHGLGSEISQAIDRYEYSANNPDGLQTLAATSSAVTQHSNSMETPSKGGSHHHHHHDPLASPLQLYSNQKPIMPKFNRARNWSTEETKILLAELERIATSHPDERRESVLRAHTTFEEIAEVLRDKGYANRDGQGCMIRWRNLLRVYKQIRASTNDGNPPSSHPNMQYAPAIEAIYHFPPDSAQYQMIGQMSPGVDATPSGHTRTWTQANGSYETPARKRAREINIMAENIDNIDQKLEQAMEYITQQNDMLRSLEERLGRTEDALRQSEATISELNKTFGEKDAKREKLEHQLLATVQALSQVITKKKAEEGES
ncbi:hypothetical protein IW140_000663 [Coemansia sp. RSA 1813]|nr:hypothetical protein EV178_000831 [Coemansia sp. RSA 1646]KAJ1773842.1 hypothetical protein LPJ74_000386 [Coemansia sp. RSA 1843]KAJ2092452.1 hypothetical protein IW138_001214 [Coemansia sp. RSA 986]KAJ2217324.1 hypothetical protein EV179_000474 [Coemansia sp. RSA 487]KAJ2572548.1 hypothetical protein IW140_000663 [Coemansia sp. RSA 1813]